MTLTLRLGDASPSEAFRKPGPTCKSCSVLEIRGLFSSNAVYHTSALDFTPVKTMIMVGNKVVMYSE